MDPASRGYKLSSLKPLYAQSLGELCKIDEKLLQMKLSVCVPPNKVRIAFVPDVETMQWHHAREEFVAKELFGSIPDVKGAIVGESLGNRAWCIWTRVWYRTEDEQPSTSTLHILRLVLENKEDDLSLMSDAQSPDSGACTSVDMVASLLFAAQHEAAMWHMTEVHLWNPTSLITRALRRVFEKPTSAGQPPKARIIDRANDNISSLMWYGDADVAGLRDVSRNDIEWIGNEKYAWC